MQWQKILVARWSALAARERLGLALATGVVSVGLVWGVLIAPAQRTRKAADAQMAVLALQLDRMQALQARARALQTQPVIAPQEALNALQTAVAGLGKNGSLLVGGEIATLTLKQVNATTLAQWLSAQPGQTLIPFEVHVQQETAAAAATSAAPAASAAAAGNTLWSGSLVFRLPPASTR